MSPKPSPGPRSRTGRRPTSTGRRPHSSRNRVAHGWPCSAATSRWRPRRAAVAGPVATLLCTIKGGVWGDLAPRRVPGTAPPAGRTGRSGRAAGPGPAGPREAGTGPACGQSIPSAGQDVGPTPTRGARLLLGRHCATGRSGERADAVVIALELALGMSVHLLPATHRPCLRIVDAQVLLPPPLPVTLLQVGTHLRVTGRGAHAGGCDHSCSAPNRAEPVSFPSRTILTSRAVQLRHRRPRPRVPVGSDAD
jgi:hypothetical protein